MQWVLTIRIVILAATPVAAEPRMEEEGPLSSSKEQWSVELAPSFSKQRTLDEFAAVKDKYPDLLGAYSPTIVEVCDLSMGTDLRYSARIAMGDRDAADKLCAKLQDAGSACIVLKD